MRFLPACFKLLTHFVPTDPPARSTACAGKWRPTELLLRLAPHPSRLWHRTMLRHRPKPDEPEPKQVYEVGVKGRLGEGCVGDWISGALCGEHSRCAVLAQFSILSP